MRTLGLACLAVVVSLLAPAPSASAADNPITPFVGSYAGRTVQAPNERLEPRDLSIKIAARGENGFTLEWTTVLHSANGTERRAYKIEFAPSDRRGIFASAMRNDMFGHSEPLDPLKGDPYVWANISGPTLTVHALLIADDGGYEIQVYTRTLTENGMALRFSRNRNGRELKTVIGVLDRSG